MSVDDVNAVVERIVSSYERHYMTAPQGRTFQECYNVRRVVPTKEHLKVYDSVSDALRSAGLDLP